MANKPTKRHLQPLSIATIGSGFLALRLLAALVEKQLMSQAEAAAVFVSAANDVRTGTEDDAPDSAGLGEELARTYEKYAAWLLGKPC